MGRAVRTGWVVVSLCLWGCGATGPSVESPAPIAAREVVPTRVVFADREGAVLYTDPGLEHPAGISAGFLDRYLAVARSPRAVRVVPARSTAYAGAIPAGSPSYWIEADHLLARAEAEKIPGSLRPVRVMAVSEPAADSIAPLFATPGGERLQVSRGGGPVLYHRYKTDPGRGWILVGEAPFFYPWAPQPPGGMGWLDPARVVTWTSNRVWVPSRGGRFTLYGSYGGARREDPTDEVFSAGLFPLPGKTRRGVLLDPQDQGFGRGKIVAEAVALELRDGRVSRYVTGYANAASSGEVGAARLLTRTELHRLIEDLRGLSGADPGGARLARWRGFVREGATADGGVHAGTIFGVLRARYGLDTNDSCTVLNRDPETMGSGDFAEMGRSAQSLGRLMEALLRIQDDPGAWLIWGDTQYTAVPDRLFWGTCLAGGTSP